MSYQFLFSTENTKIALGNITTVCVQHNEEGVMKATNIPTKIADLIEVAPADKLAD